MFKSAARFPLFVGGFLRKCGFLKCLLYVHVAFVLFFFGYWVGKNEVKSESECVETPIDCRLVWDGKKYKPKFISRCLKPGDQKR